jgi:Uma2 family endonuclease
MSSLPVPRTPSLSRPRPDIRPVPFTLILADREIIIPASAHTLGGFRDWAKSEDFPERGRFSFIDQELIIDMSPEELETHNKVKSETGRTLLNLNRKLKRGEFYSDGTLLTNVAAGLSTEPDALFVTWECLETGRIRLIPREGEEAEYIELEGTPDWVMEIVSKSSVRKDTKKLREQYFRAGIPEYWLIDARGPEIKFQILIRGETDYVDAPGRAGWQESPLFQRHFRLVRRRNQANRWEYILQVKSLRR